jgi:hypothetical protein
MKTSWPFGGMISTTGAPFSTCSCVGIGTISLYSTFLLPPFSWS